MTFAKKYDPKERETQIREFWEKEGIFSFNQKSNKPVFSIDTPPPTVSGRMHIGHAFSYTQTDFIARYKRMNGYEVFYPFGTDDNGLATEKIVQKEKGVDLRKLSREEAVKITMDFLEKNRPQFVQDWKNLGISCDFEGLGYSTISPYSQKLSQKSFLQLVDKGLIERRKGPIPWDRQFQTTIAQAELEDKETTSTMNYIKAKLKGTENTYILYATTRPEMIFACQGFSVEDSGDYVKLEIEGEYWIFGATTYKEKIEKISSNYKVVENLKGRDFIGETVIIPLIDKEITITHDQSIKADLGTGSAYFCSFGGLEDIEYFNRHNLEIVEILNKDGRLNSLCGEFEGLIASEAGRKEVSNKLKELGNLVYEEKINQVVNVGERSGVPVEYIASEQWFVKYLDRKEEFWEFAQKFNWIPEFMKERLENWIKGLNWDWGFARQRHFGVPIPVWINTKTNSVVYPKEDMLPLDPNSTPIPENLCEDGYTPQDYVGEADVFDTWFTSASTPILATNLIENGQDKLFPMDLRPQGHDIINFWLFYTMAKNNLIFEKNPFSEVAISGWVLAPDGTKMSKSKGNTIAPQTIVEKYSNDALRYAASSMKLGYDTPFQEKEVQTGKRVITKMFNACKFADMLLGDFTKKDKDYSYDSLRKIDQWLLAKMAKTIDISTKSMDNYDYSKAKYESEQFFMRDVADNYIEIVKKRLWNPDNYGEDTKKAQFALYHGLLSSVKLFSPILPFITEEVYQNFFSKYEDETSIHVSSWPRFESKYYNEELEKAGDEMVSVVAAVRKLKSEANVSMKTSLKCLTIDCSDNTKSFVEDSLDDLKSVTGAELVEFGKGTIETDSSNVKINAEIRKE